MISSYGSLTKGDSLQFKAFVNYADLFPKDPKSKEYLFSAALICFEKKEYERNVDILERIIREYPESFEGKKAYRMLFEQYNNSKKLYNSEKIVKRFSKLKNLNEEEKKFVKEELFQSIIRIAKFEEERNNLLGAAENYYRSVQENMSDNSAPAALWKAVTLFSKVKDWEKVVEIYYLILNKYYNSVDEKKVRIAPLALNGLAYTVSDSLEKYNFYKEGFIKDKKDGYLLAAKLLERFYKEFPDFNFNKKNLSKINLSNGAYYYKKGGNINKSIDLNKKYINKFTKLETKDKKIARYNELVSLYKKNGDKKNVLELNSFIGENFSGSVVSVKSFYDNAKHYKKSNNSRKSLEEYEKAFNAFKKLKNKEDITNSLFYGSEAHFNLLEDKFKEYKAIKFDRVKSLAQLDKKIKQKDKLLNTLKKGYEKVISYNQKEYGQSLIRIAEIFEDFGTARYEQKRFNLRKLEERLASENGIVDDVVSFYGISKKQYLLSLKNIEKFISAWNSYLESQISQINDRISRNPEDSNLLDLKLMLESDDTIEKTERLVNKAKAKISELNYKLGTLYDNLIETYTSIDRKSLDSKTYSLTFFDEYDAIIQSISVSLIEKAIEAYNENIKYSKDFSIKNSWIKKSEERVEALPLTLINIYTRLTRNVISEYKRQDEKLTKLIKYRVRRDQDGYVKPTLVRLNGKEPFYRVHENLESMVEYVEKYVKFGLDTYKNNDSKIKSDTDREKFYNYYIEKVLAFVDILDEFSEYNKNAQIRLNEDLAKSEIFFEMYLDEADEYINGYDQNRSDINNISIEILDQLKEYCEDKNYLNDNLNPIFYQLMKRAPYDYFEQFGLKEKKRFIYTDKSWLTSDKFVKDWDKETTDSSLWKAPIIKDKFVLKNDSNINKSIGDWIWTSIKETEDFRIIIFRKDFNLSTPPLDATISIAADDKYGFRINSKSYFDMIIKDEKDTYADLYDDDYENWDYLRTTSIFKGLNEGSNSLILYCIDTDKSSNGIYVNLEVDLLENNFSEKTNFVKRKKIVKINEEMGKGEKKQYEILKKGYLR